MLTVQKTCALRLFVITEAEDRREPVAQVAGYVGKRMESAVQYSQSQWQSTELHTRSTISQVDDPSIVVQELPAVVGDLSRDAVRILDVLLS